MSIDTDTTALDDAFVFELDRPPAGNPDRFTARWTLAGAGLAQVWRYGTLDLDAPSGRLLLRGANGTGKTTALEALCPFLLDLNTKRLAAGKARPTTLSLLMAEGSGGKRRTGYAWLTFATPADADNPAAEQSWGVRLQYGPNSTPKVRVVPFTVPGRPGRDLPLTGTDGAALTAEEFHTAVTDAGGIVFPDPAEYVEHLALTVWSAVPDQVESLAQRIREVRNPSVLGEVTPTSAAAALRSSLPTVNPSVVNATADALAETDATRAAFDRDRAAAVTLAEFASVWSGHVVDVVGTAHAAAQDAHTELAAAAAEAETAEDAHEKARTREAETARAAADASSEAVKADTRVRELEDSEAYRAATDLTGLRREAAAERDAADRSLRELTSTADGVADAGTRLVGELGDLAANLTELVEPLPGAAAPPLVWSPRPRATFRVADEVADPGPGLTIVTSAADLTEAADHWSKRSRDLVARAERAELLVGDHKRQVAPAAVRAETARRDAETAVRRVEEHRQESHRTARRAETVRDTLLAAVTRWAVEHPDLTSHPDASDPGDGADGPDSGLGPDTVAALATAEPGQVLAAADEWLAAVQAAGTDRVGQLRAVAAGHRATEADLRAQAEDLATQAARLRSGKLLSLPRPAWAGSAPEHATLVGDVLTWAPGFTDTDAQARIEVAIADTGLLGAEVTAAGATGHPATGTGSWTVTLANAERDDNLTAVLAVDPDHPQAGHVAGVLARIGYTDTGLPGEIVAGDLVVCGDGSFRVGPLHGDRLAGVADRTPPTAALIGTRQRRAAALVEAARLEAEAKALLGRADEAHGQAKAADRDAAALLAAVRTFPTLRPLTDAEARRAAAAQAVLDAEEKSQLATETARVATDAATEAAADWARRCADLAVPADMGELATLAQNARTEAGGWSRAAQTLRGRLVANLVGIEARAAANDNAYSRLAELRNDAVATHETAVRAEERVAVQEEIAGASIQEVLAALATARTDKDRFDRALPGLDEAAKAAYGEMTAAAERRRNTVEEVQRLTPLATVATERLRLLVAASGVQAALTTTLDPETGNEAAPDGEQRDVGDLSGEGRDMYRMTAPELLTVAAGLLAGRRSAGRKMLADRYDRARAELVAWSLDHGEPVGELETFVLTHQEETYTPAAAALQAATLARRAAGQLDAAEEAVLRDFIIGKLPSSIGLAWQQLLDWRREVNAKMKDASASSGVGVQIDIRPDDAMSPAVRTVYELSCKTSAANRTEEQKLAVGGAIRALIDAADGESMVEKVAAAVDIRDWVDVSYQVTRPGQDPKRWTARTGLSGGERRLVVLAPMLAAVAAGYDSMDPGGLRLVALDEVPAEVDEAGREGLARYLAELDLDLVCTSYLWDGAPGAWDGIDAWDFEGGEDGLVVAFPMLVRGLDGLPGDDRWPLDSDIDTGAGESV